MANDNKTKQRQKIKNIKKKQAIPERKKIEKIVEKPEPKKTRKISEKYLKEEIHVEKSMREHLKNQPLDEEYEKQKQAEIDFFCDPYSSVPLKIEKIKSTDNETEKDDDEEIEAHSTHSNESSPNTHMASTYIGHEHESVVAKFELTRISYDEMKLLFHPEVKRDYKGIEFYLMMIFSHLFLLAPTCNDEEKNIHENDIDDGIFIQDAPSIKKISNKFLLLDRIHESASSEFLTANGDLRNYEKLIDNDVYRLNCDRKFTPIYVPPMPMNFESIDKIINEKKFLKILVENLKFDQHKMFSSEHYVARIIEKLYDEYERRMSLSVVETLRNKLKNLRDLKDENFPNQQKSSKTLKSEEISLIQQIKNARLKLHVEEQYDHKIIKSLLENYKSLKTIRKQQGYSMTDISLKIQKLNSDDLTSLRQAQRQQEYDAELNEMMAEEFEKYYGAKQKYKEFLKNSNDPDKISNENEEVVKKPKKPDIDKIVSEINEIYDKIPTQEPQLKIILLHNESIVNTTKPSKEKLKKINRISYRIELEIDGEIVGSTKHCRLDEDFSIPIQSAFILKLTKHLPEKIKLMVRMTEFCNILSKLNFYRFMR